MNTTPPAVRALSDQLLTRATPRQRQAYTNLTDDGWILRAWHVTDHDTILVDGLTNTGTPYTGAIDTNGHLTGRGTEDPPAWTIGITQTGIQEMTEAEHALQRGRVQLAVQLDPARRRHAHVRPAIRTAISAPVLDGLAELFAR